MKKTVIILITLLLLVAMLTGCGAPSTKGLTLQEGKLLIGVDDSYKPMEFIDEKTGERVGFDIDLAKALGQELGVEIEFKSTAWDSIFIGLDTAKYDCIISSVSMTTERLENMEFTKPYLSNGQVIIVRAGDTSIKTAADLAGKKVGVQFQTTADTACEKQRQTIDFNLIKYDTGDLTVLALKSGNVDCAVVDMAVAIGWIIDQPDQYTITSASLTNEPISIAVKKGNTKLRDALQEALDNIAKDGKLTEISNKWLKADYTKNIDTNLKQ